MRHCFANVQSGRHTDTHTHKKKDRHLCNGGFYFLSLCDTLVLLEAASHIPEKKKKAPKYPPSFFTAQIRHALV